MSLLIHDPLTRFIAQVVAIILVSRALGLLLRRFGQPMVIAEVIAGIVLGPSLLGWLWPTGLAELFAPDSLRVLQLVSQLGLILYMFLVGLELDPALLRGRGHTSVAISHTSIIVPFAMGSVLALYLYPRVASPQVPFSSFVLFLGAAMSITAFPVLARILAERRLTRSKLGAITTACAAVDDVTAWCLLAFVVASARSTGIQGALITTGLAIAYILIVLFVVRPLLARVGARVGNRRGLTQNLVAVTILLLLASSWTTELIGIHALFGAFLFGVALPKQGGFAHALAEKLEDTVLVILLPLFFAFSGVRTQIRSLDSPDAWWMCGLIVTVACAGKFGGSAIAARLTGLSWRESSALGVLMNTRGLMELIVLNIGLDLGVITPKLFTMLVIMALVTTFITTPVVKRIYPDEEMTREIVATATEHVLLPARPSFTVLICVAYERSGPAMIALAGGLIGKASDAKIYALQLVPTTERRSFYVHPQPEAASVETLRPLLDRATEIGVVVKPLSFVSADPAEDICNVAQAKGTDLILMGWHKPVLGRAMLAGTVSRVMKDATSDVGVLVDRGLVDLRRVLVPFLATPHDIAALALARRLLSRVESVTVLHIVKPERRLQDATGARENLQETFDDEGGRVLFRVVEHDVPEQAVLEECDNGYDLVVIGTGRDWGLDERPFPLQRERLIAECPVSMFIVHHGTAKALERAPSAARREEASPSPTLS